MKETQSFGQGVALETRIRETVLRALPDDSVVATLRHVTADVLEAVDLWLMQHEPTTPTATNGEAITLITTLRTSALREQTRTVQVPPPLTPEPPEALQ